ncbi:MAG: LuxR C-terminal-related transcriptional regulator [Pseudomonadota bacterium]|nr:LuxR C-terminal-related transcriptional regulator [Pseudomonadota bacterium]
MISFVAPTGFGKTVSMAQYFTSLQQTDKTCIWIRLDEHDDAIESLLHPLRMALEAEVGAGGTTDDSFALSFGLASGGILALLEQFEDPTVIFIDNLNSCTDPRLGEFLDALMFQTRDNIRLVWSSTFMPSISIGKAKLQHLIRNVGMEHLKLSFDETQHLLGPEVCADIGTEGIRTLLDKTEGWVAGLRMALLILEDATDPIQCLDTFSGADQDISLLLREKVLSAFRPPVMRFLLAAAYLRAFSAEQLAHVIEDDNTIRKLEFLKQRNAFIIPLDRQGNTFRLHGLFRDCLRLEADKVFSEEYRSKLYRRAAQWCAKTGDWQDAVQYAFKAGDSELVAQVLDQAAPALVRDLGKVHTFVAWVDRLIADDVVRLGSETTFWYVYSLIFHRRYANAELHHARLDALAKRSAEVSDAEGDEFRQRVDHLQVCIALLTDRLNEALVRADSWLAAPGTKDPFDIGWVRCVRAICLLTSYDFAEARKAQRESERYVREVGSPYMIAWCSLVRGTIELYAGNVSVAYRDIMDSRAEAAAALGEDAEMCDTMATIASKCALELGLHDEAAELVEYGLRSASLHGTVGSTGMAFDTALQLCQTPDETARTVQRLRDIARSYPPRLSNMLSCYVAAKLTASDRVEEAKIEVGRIGLDLATGQVMTEDDSLPRSAELYAATAISILSASGDARRAKLLIERETASAKEDGRMGRLIELDLASMELAVRINDYAVARRHLLSAVRAAAPRGAVQPFRTVRASIARLLAVEDLSDSLFPREEERKFFAAIRPHTLAQTAAVQDDFDDQVLESLTPRETELLRFVGFGLSNQQIAEQAEVSVTTIKWHLKNLYRKLDVANRTAAVARARSMGLIKG